MTRNGEPKTRVSKAVHAKPAERGLGPHGGGWNVRQASAWSGIGENHLRVLAKRREIPCYFIGRRILSQADLAREFGLTRARICQLVKEGLPTRQDGKLNRAAAVEWLELRRSLSFRGGWGRVRRKSELAQLLAS